MKTRMIDERAGHAFRALSGYMGSLGGFIESAYGLTSSDRTRALVAAMEANPRVRKIDRKQPDRQRDAKVRQALRQSWATECQLRLRARHEPELLLDLLHGVAPEAYYAVYHAARALTIAQGNPSKDTHAAGLNAVARDVDGGRLVPPFDRSVSGGPKREQFRWTGTPDAPDPLTTFLATTRERSLEKKKADWRRTHKAARVSPHQAEKLAQDLRATNVFDLLWRLRTGSHYRDADAFLDGVSTAEEAESFLGSFTTVVEAAVTTLNLATARHLGTPAFCEIAADLGTGPRADIYDAVAERHTVLTVKGGRRR